jgi:hypothetical protein
MAGRTASCAQLAVACTQARRASATHGEVPCTQAALALRLAPLAVTAADLGGARRVSGAHARTARRCVTVRCVCVRARTPKRSQRPCARICMADCADCVCAMHRPRGALRVVASAAAVPAPNEQVARARPRAGCAARLLAAALTRCTHVVPRSLHLRRHPCWALSGSSCGRTPSAARFWARARYARRGGVAGACLRPLSRA